MLHPTPTLPVQRPLNVARAPAVPAPERADAATLSHHLGLGELRAALAEGWHIVQPIFARPQWSALDDRQLAYHFVLQRDRSTRLLTVPKCRPVQRFIREQSLHVQGR